MTNRAKTFDVHVATELEEDTSFVTVPLRSIALENNLRGYGVALEYAHFMNSYENINESNNKFYWTDNLGSGLNSVTVPVGHYTAATLVSTLSALTNAVDTTTISYNAATNRATITAGNVGTGGHFGTEGPNSINPVLGLTRDDRNTTVAPAGTLALSGIVDLSGPKILSIEMPELADSSISRRGGTFLKHIPLHANFGETMTWVAKELAFKHIKSQSLENLTLRLSDENGVPFKLKKNTRFFLNLLMQPLQ
jgi:hypothetical protein